ncbi:hypothetical protein DL237_15055 [Pseudooceanicola sediminis]|uniref:FUSC family protein n=1 Tax=Pseudooceanicola sediminis TaxID=2211117 RepID=A0A399J586_9RHOB|nr:FUSC family protein [Pseudooceanicola sediminis]RII37986.1 hypothetical protein DL237_15055 [Pseudooceanicola sediminis]|tara:strand:+ start:2898 stop:3887 length:990 start_codon:yes stop_codon:yes gene_type:complete
MQHWIWRAVQLFVAAACALALAWMLGLHNPYWAAMPVWVVSQAYREDLVIRAILRVLGTLLGAAIGLAALHFLPNPVLLTLALGLAVGGATLAAFWIGTVYSYGALMAAITVAVVILPAVANHAAPLNLAVDRVWCTLIGVVAVTAATFPFTPVRGEKLALRKNHGGVRALKNGAVAMGCAIFGMTVALLTGQFWAVGLALALSIFSAIMGGMPDARPVIRYILPGSAIGVAAGIVYRLIGESLALTPLGLYLLVAAFLAAGALLRANPKTAPFGLDSNMIFLLTAEVGTIGHGAVNELMGGAAMLVAALIVSTLHRWLLPPGLSEKPA